MIIDFTVENFRSIKAAVTLSAVAQRTRRGTGRDGHSRRYAKPDYEIARPRSVEGRDFALLPVLGIFGANASGKTNVLKALDFLLILMTHGRADRGQLVGCIAPFRLDSATANAPVQFAIRIAINGMLYSYSIALQETRIVFERLDYTPPSPLRSRLLFERRWEGDRETWQNGQAFAGDHLGLQSNLEWHMPYLSLLVQRQEVNVITPMVKWLRARRPGGSLGLGAVHEQMLLEHAQIRPQDLDRITHTLRSFDTGIESLELVHDGSPSANGQEHTLNHLVAWHNTSTGKVALPFKEESAGTRRLVGLIAEILFALALGVPVLVDELDGSLHPHVAREIVAWFQDPTTNPNCTQLVFSSHDSSLLSDYLLRRDQIWFTQKRSDGSTELYSLSDYKVRNDLAVERAYLDGRFDAVPILPADWDLTPFKEPSPA